MSLKKCKALQLLPVSPSHLQFLAYVSIAIKTIIYRTLYGFSVALHEHLKNTSPNNAKIPLNKTLLSGTMDSIFNLGHKTYGQCLIAVSVSVVLGGIQLAWNCRGTLGQNTKVQQHVEETDEETRFKHMATSKLHCQTVDYLQKQRCFYPV